jgi:hypothetical protein
MLTTALDFAREVMITAGVPIALALAWRLLSIAEAHGYRTTYAAAVLKAVGAGQLVAQSQGLSVFDPAGRAVAVQAGAAYLMQTVPDAGAALGITSETDHAARVDTQIGLMAAQTAATALAATATPQVLASLAAGAASLIPKPPTS